MITVKVQLLSVILFSAGLHPDKLNFQKEISEGSTIGDLFTELAAEYGPLFKEEVYNPDTRTVHPLVGVLVNGRMLQSLRGLETVLLQGDIIVMWPAITGG